jgi:hypothetical protein
MIVPWFAGVGVEGLSDRDTVSGVRSRRRRIEVINYMSGN